ncbi:MAG: TonB-dependent receptor [Marinibacterium sp.]|nr:TonB-dependent receptor [Marinibacterium sp.]
MISTSSRLLASVSLAVLAATPALAQDTTTDLGTIVVSGGFTPIEEETYGRAASVITSEEIEARGIKTVQDALRAVPGVSVNGSGDSFTQVRIRGGEGNHTLILLDGVPMSAGDSEYILSGLQTANIERIEVLRGPQSVFYGSNASSGVVNIITKKGGLGHEYGATVEFGSGYSASARYSYRNDRGGVALGLSRLDDDGYDYSGSDGEKDSIKRDTLTLTGDYKLTDAWKLGLLYRKSDETYKYDSTNFAATTPEGYVVDNPRPESDRDEELYQIYTELDTLDGRLLHRLSFDQTNNDRSTNNGPKTKAERKRARYLASFGLDGAPAGDSNHLLNGILEWNEDNSSTNPDYERQRNSYALEYRGQFDGGLNLQAGLRYDDNKTFKDDFTWTLAGSYALQPGVRMHASAGTGIVDPSYFELFANSFGYLGNPNLKPEKNQSVDLGVEFEMLAGRGLLDVTVFYDELTDEITSRFDPDLGSLTYYNQEGDSKRSGIELAGTYAATDMLDLALNYTYLDAKNPDGTVEVRRPRHELMLSATQRFLDGRGSVTADLRYVGGNYDTQFFGAFETKQLSDFATVNLSAQYEITPGVKVTGRVVNLFDAEYSDVWGYATRGQTFYAGLSASF